MSGSGDNGSSWGDFLKWGAAIGTAALGVAAAVAVHQSAEEKPNYSYQHTPRNASRDPGNAGRSSHSYPKRKVQIDEICSICYDGVQDNCKAFIEPCKHIYHRTCLEQWEQECLKTGKHGKCPNCQGHYKVVNPTNAVGNQIISEQCCICLSKGIEDVKIILQPCLHVFHKICFRQCEFKSEKICPRCKKYYGS